MKLKNLFILLMFFISPGIFTVEIEPELKKLSINAELFPWHDLPKDIKEEILKYFTNWKLDKKNKQELASSLIKSVRNYNSELSKTLNKELSQKITDSFKDFLSKNLTDQDYKNLNEYILETLDGLKLRILLKQSLPEGFILLVKLLVRLNKLDTSITNKHGYTMLLLATVNGRVDIAKLLIKAGANVNAANNNEQTALMFASSEGHKDIAALLIKSGADINALNARENSALILASKMAIKILQNY